MVVVGLAPRTLKTRRRGAREKYRDKKPLDFFRYTTLITLPISYTKLQDALLFSSHWKISASQAQSNPYNTIYLYI